MNQIGECDLNKYKDFLYKLKVKLNRMDEIIKSIKSELWSIVSELDDEDFLHTAEDVLGPRVNELQYALDRIENFWPDYSLLLFKRK